MSAPIRKSETIKTKKTLLRKYDMQMKLYRENNLTEKYLPTYTIEPKKNKKEGSRNAFIYNLTYYKVKQKKPTSPTNSSQIYATSAMEAEQNFYAMSKGLNIVVLYATKTNEQNAKKQNLFNVHWRLRKNRKLK